jgi:hypothetical protein
MIHNKLISDLTVALTGQVLNYKLTTTYSPTQTSV